MADLNVNVIARWVDRLSGGAKASVKAISGVTTAQKAQAAATANTTKAAGLATKAADLAAKASAGVTSATLAQTRAASDAAEGAAAQASALDRMSASAERASSSMGTLLRMQQRGRQAMVDMKASAEALTSKLAELGLAEMAARQMERVGGSIERPLEHAAEKSAAFNERMTGLGITAEMTDRQLRPIRASILATAGRYAIDPEDVAELYTAARRSGVFKTVSQINAAGAVSTGFMRLNNTMNPNDKITGDEIGAATASATREYGFAATTRGLTAFYGMMNAAEKLGGGMNHKGMLEYATKTGGFLKAWGAGDRRGLADLLLAQQITKQYAHTPEESGMYVADLVQQLGLRRTQIRFGRHGVDLAASVRKGEAAGRSPLETIATLVKSMTHGGKMEEIAKLVGNQQAAIALVALIQNMAKFKAGQKVLLGGDKSGVNQRQYMVDVARAASSQAAQFQRLQVAGQNLAVAVGTQLAPVFTGLAWALTKVADLVTNLVQKHPWWTRAIGVTVIAVGGLAIVLGALVGALAAVGIAYVTLKFMPTLFSLLTRGALGWTAALLTNPIFLIVAGVAALAVGGYELIKHWSAVKTWLAGFWDWIKRAATSAFEAVKKFFTWSPPKWLGAVASIAAMMAPGGAVLAAPIGAAVQAAATPKPPAHTVKVEQHFHINGAEHIDHKALAKEMKRLSAEGLDRALHDGASE